MIAKYTLNPYNAAEGMSLKDAAFAAGKSERVIRRWCTEHGLGRRVGDGVWIVSRVALQMFLDGDMAALASYRDFGVRASFEPVRKYYDRFDLGHLLELREFSL